MCMCHCNITESDRQASGWAYSRYERQLAAVYF